MNNPTFRQAATPRPSNSRMRYVQKQLDADADAVLRELAFVLAMTQRVRQDMRCEKDEREAATV
jgi:hypothetical protein